MDIKYLIEKRPRNLKGSLSNVDIEFLYSKVLEYKPQNIAEIGVASGMSSAAILTAVKELNELNNDKHTLYSFDLLNHCYWDKSLSIGFAVTKYYNYLAPYFNLKTGKTALNFQNFYEENTLDFVFIDANHKHPYPCLDVLIVLPFIKTGGIICMHDINLPKIHADFQVWGVKHLFDEITAKKDQSEATPPNIGCFQIGDKAEMKKQILSILKAHEFEMQPSKDYETYLNSLV